jgi:hypothetical protein
MSGGVVHPRTGRVVREGSPDNLEAKVLGLEGTIRELMTAVADLQLRLSSVDGADVPWPADTYDPPRQGFRAKGRRG